MSDRRQCLHDNLVEAFEELPGSYPSLSWLPSEAVPLLAEEIERSIKPGGQGRLYAPDQFTLSFFPRDMEPWAPNSSQFRQDVARDVRAAVRACGLLAVRDLHVTVAGDPTLLARQVRVIAWHSRDPLKFSKTLPVSEGGAPDQPPSGAFLLVGGRQLFPIRAAKSTIGRRLDNDIVLEDPHVSRRHAEIRLDQNRYVVRDIGSTVGTMVNGRPIQQHALTPGDVIVIAGIQLIYGEDGGPAPDRTSPLKPPTADGLERITPIQLRLLNRLRKRSAK